MLNKSDMPSHTGDAPDRGILLAQVANAFWLVDGEPHLDALLAADEPYPTPVHCLQFDSMFDMATATPEGLDPSSLWSVHPAIIERLKRHDEIIFVPFGDDS